MILALLLACNPAETGTTTLRHAWSEPDWNASPFPSDHRLEDGGVPLDVFPNPDDVVFVAKLVALRDERLTGFGTTSPVHLHASAPLAPQPAGYRDEGDVFLLGITGEDAGVRLPIEVSVVDDAGPFGGDDLLSLLPLQGRPLRPGATYAAVVLRSLGDATGAPLATDPQLQAVLDGDTSALGEGASSYEAALDALDVPLDEVAGLAVFTTWDPTTELHLWLDAARASGPLALDDAPALDVVHGDFCVYRATLAMPSFQSGDPPYLTEGGTVIWDGDTPVLQGFETASVDLTVPRAPMPDDGWPLAVFVRTGGGGEDPLVERGLQDADHQPLEEGGGPARTFARAGFAGLEVDGPHGGLRNVTGGDEQFLMFNVLNPGAMRDNVRQSAVELALLPDLLATLTVDTSGCDGASEEARFDTDRLALMGHSMGATIAPLTMGLDVGYGGVVLSGAGGSWIHNVMVKQSPLEVRPIAEAMLGYEGGELHAHDPVLALLQWLGESADPPVYGRAVQASGAHVLMLQGIVDTYILPPIANTTSLALGLDLAGTALDADHPDLAAFTPLEEDLAWVGGDALALPASANRDGSTRIVVQHAEDGVQDGHEVVFQLDGPKRQYGGFLETLGEDAPTVPEG